MTENINEKSRLSRRRRRRLRIAALALVIFICGMFVGGGLTMHFIWMRFQSDMKNPDLIPERISRRLTRKLDLTDEQAGKVREILFERHYALLKIRDDVIPKMDKELEQTRQDIEAILTPEQAKKWNEIYNKMRELWIPPQTADIEEH